MAKTVGMLTGGGDCPGLNAVIRAVVRQSDAQGWDSVAVLEGWRGMVEGRFRDLGVQDRLQLPQAHLSDGIAVGPGRNRTALSSNSRIARWSQ